MLNNNDCVLGMPHMQCPSCKQTFDLSKNQIDKLSKRQRKAMLDDRRSYGFATSSNRSGDDSPKSTPSEMPERNFVVVTCHNVDCDQYTKFKVLELPRIKASTADVEI